MKLLLINAVSSRLDIENVYPPLGLGYIASYLMQQMPAVDIKIIEGNFEKEIRSYQPDLVGISSVSQNYGGAMRLAELCRGLGLPVVMGGTHITTLPSTLTDDMDVAVIGEGEQTMLDLCRVFEKGEFEPDQLKTIPGLAFRDKTGGLVFTPDREPISPLDKLPFPARSLMRIPYRGQLYLFSSRGCPYKCTFCQSTRFFNTVRTLSADYVVRELLHLIETYRPVAVSFYDDLFISNKARLREIVTLIERHGINRETEFFVNVRANQADEETADLLKRMNVSMVNLGLESGSDKILHFLKPKKASVAMNTKAVAIFNKAGLKTNGSFIIGSPIETEEDLIECYRYLKNSRLSVFTTYVLVPLPNTPLWKLAEEKNLVSDRMDWSTLKMEVEPYFRDGRVLLSPLNRHELYLWYVKFSRLGKRRQLKTRLKLVFRHPEKVFPLLLKKFKLWWTNTHTPIGNRV
ncbi:MAG: B12-binding domain-containing radical SAM protein [Spirochaetales bacterium]|nr:B12-binding domain-containing radical SAM protein [Spirochaetales bacterium]